MSKVTGETQDVDNLQIAATIYAFDVPLHKDNPYDVQAGDGIKGTKVIWHFAQTDAAGNSPKEIAAKFFDDVWIAANPQHPLSVCKHAFDWLADLKHMMKTGKGVSMYYGPSCRITNTRKAAVMLALGHKLLGWQRNEVVTTWCFHETTAADAALYDDEKLYEKLPDAPISYAKGAILGHLAMIDASKSVQHAVVQHRGRTAIIGKDMPKQSLDTLEKILFRK